MSHLPPHTLGAPARPCLPPPLSWREASHWPERRRLERLIYRRFADDHGAHIRHFLPRLFGLWQGGMPLATVGIGLAREGRLFQEHYLDGSAEAFLTRQLGRPVAREALAEIGNLASQRPGLQRQLFVHLIDQLVIEELGWVLFTATPAVANGLQRLGIALHDLMPADPTRLGRAQADWGHYYAQHPRVMAGDLHRAHATLSARGLLPICREVPHARHA